MTHSEHSESVAQTGIARGDLAQNLVAFQVPMEERTMGLLLQEHTDIGKRPVDQNKYKGGSDT